jgi:hypothetical protein
MVFSSLTDPVAVARAHAAFVLIWHHLVAKGQVSAATSLERERLARIIAGLAPICVDEVELAERARRRIIRLGRHISPDHRITDDCPIHPIRRFALGSKAALKCPAGQGLDRPRRNRNGVGDSV